MPWGLYFFRRIGGFVKRAAPVLRNVARIGGAITATVGLVALGATVLRRLLPRQTGEKP